MPRPFALGPTPQLPDAFVDETVAGARVDRPGSASLDEPEAGVVVDRLPRYVR